jgi:DNA-binding MarR family transcriptional regulator
MTDINLKLVVGDGAARRQRGGAAEVDERAVIELIELLFFAYRDFVSEPDEMLKGLGFGRAHHRVIHFVGRNPGIRVAELLDILRITKQSLARVLRELIETGHVRQRPGTADRRQRLLFLTARGRELHSRLIEPQMARVRQAVDGRGADGGAMLRDLLLGLIDAGDRAHVRALAERAGQERKRAGESDDGGA